MKKIRRTAMLFLALAAVTFLNLRGPAFERSDAEAAFNNTGQILSEEYMLGGNAFGVKFFTKGVIVVAITHVETAGGSVCPAERSGLKKGDIILSVNGEEISSAESFAVVINKCGKTGAVLCLTRDGTAMEKKVMPELSLKDGEYKIGLWVRDSTAGIGTVTYVNKRTGEFGGLGHGVCDVDTGLLMPLERGTVVDVTVTGAVKGEPDAPGELKGTFSPEAEGVLTANTEAGVFGKLNNVRQGETVSIGTKDTVTEGKAQIYTTVQGTTPEKFDVEIVKIYRSSGKTKNFMIRVTDKKLLDMTGGIVQGMSGSPVVQNGKLVGAVTHVLINDPKRGYGIFIENMLEESKK